LILGQGDANIVSVDTSDQCNPVVTVEHNAGCPIATGNELTIWLDNNPWALAIFLLIVGPVIAIFGKKWFPHIAGIVACLTVMDLIVVFAAHMGWLATSWSPWVVLVVAILIGMIVGGIIAKAVWFAVGLVGIVAGCCLGLFLFGIMAASTNHAENWEMIVFAVLGSIIIGILAFKWGKEIVILCTSFIGSYMFMRGWTFIFEGYPSEGEIWSDIQEGHELEITATFWIFFAVWLVSFVISTVIQFKIMDDHDDLKGHYARVR